MKIEMMVLTMLLLGGGAASAQTACPSGVAAGSAQCGPSSLVSPDESGSRARGRQLLPEEKWADGWGAIAGDGESAIGVATDFPSKRKAKKAALNDCKERGGGRCKVTYTFVNQCAAIILGDTMYATAAARTKHDAVDRGTQKCQEEGQANCRVFWSGCSWAWRVW